MNMCSHCHFMTDERYCPSCGHNAELPRMDCDCSACVPEPRSSSYTSTRYADELPEADFYGEG